MTRQSYKTKFLSRANNYKSAPGKFMKKEAFPKQDLQKNVFMSITTQIDIMTWKIRLLLTWIMWTR